MVHLSDILSDNQIATLRELEVLNESHLCRLIIGEEFHKQLIEGKTWEEAMEYLGNRVWNIANINYCFSAGTIKKYYSWYKKKLPR